MKCLRCGHCCKYYCVVIVDDPDKDFDPENIDNINDNTFFHEGNGEPCKHLIGDKPGEYSCAVHDKSWYPSTPCFHHGQIEKDENQNCRIGEYKLKRKHHE